MTTPLTLEKKIAHSAEIIAQEYVVKLRFENALPDRRELILTKMRRDPALLEWLELAGQPEANWKETVDQLVKQSLALQRKWAQQDLSLHNRLIELVKNRNEARRPKNWFGMPEHETDKLIHWTNQKPAELAIKLREAYRAIEDANLLPELKRLLEASLERRTDDGLLCQVVEALEAARDHLNYCGYGDSWERECAKGLPEKIEAALEAAGCNKPDETDKPPLPEHKCNRCGRSFKDTSALNGHRKHSVKCKQEPLLRNILYRNVSAIIPTDTQTQNQVDSLINDGDAMWFWWTKSVWIKGVKPRNPDNGGRISANSLFLFWTPKAINERYRTWWKIWEERIEWQKTNTPDEIVYPQRGSPTGAAPITTVAEFGEELMGQLKHFKFFKQNPDEKSSD